MIRTPFHRSISLFALIAIPSLGACGDMLQAIGMPKGIASAMFQKEEAVQQVDGIPFSDPSLKSAIGARSRFAAVKKVAIVSYEQSSKTEFVSPQRITGGKTYLRGIKSWEKALAAHGFQVVPIETVTADPVYKGYDWRQAMSEMFDSMGSMLANMISSLLSVTSGDIAGVVDSAAALYASAAVPGMAGAPKGVADVLERLQKVESQNTSSGAGSAQPGAGAGRSVVTKMEALIRSMGGDMSAQALYIPASHRKDAIGRLAALQKAPGEWATGETADPFLAELARSLGVDAVVMIRSSVCWDVSAGNVGFCMNDQSYVVFYDQNGAVLPTPMIENPPSQADAKVKAGVKSYARTDLNPDQKRMLVSAKDTYDKIMQEASSRNLKAQDTLLIAWAPDDAEMSMVDSLADHVVATVEKAGGR